MRCTTKSSFVLVVCLLSLLFIGPYAWAQATTSLRGTITDPSGAAILDAAVRLINVDNNVTRTVTSDQEGSYVFPSLPPGTYRLEVEVAGFAKYEQTRLQLLVNLPATVNVKMKIGQTQETVTVTEATPVINTTDASIGNAFNENQVKMLPLEGRNVPDLLSLQPGVAYANNRPDVPNWDTRTGAVNGARSDQSNVTVDGIAVNDEGGHAFTSVLPVTLDSVQEFRVTTTNYNADQGSSSGAQVAMVTKSGTNEFHGSAYEYHRNTYTSANDYFIKNGQITNCLDNNIPLSSRECNQAPKLIRNIFGASLGGPIKKDRLFLFMNYEGTRRAEQQSQTSAVPSLTMRDGIIQYQCETSTDCPGGQVSVPNFLNPSQTDTFNIAQGYRALTPTDLTAMDPRGIGPSTAMLQYLNSWPVPNCTNTGDGFNYTCFNFSAPISLTQNVYIARMDYNITRDSKHRLSLTGALTNENDAGIPFLPGQPPAHTNVNYNKGLIANYNSVLSNSLINNFRYGFVRESLGVIGNSNQDWIYFRGLTTDQPNPNAVTRTHAFQRPIHNFADDLTWVHGNHTWQFGTQVEIIRTPSNSQLSSFSHASANASWTLGSGYAQTKSPLNPGYTCSSSDPKSCLENGSPFVDPNFANAYDYPIQALLGMVTEVDPQYNFKRDGTALPDGAALPRRYGINGYEFYAQDTWKVRPTFTVTLGLRWSLFSPPWETDGLQVQPTMNLGKWFQNRAREGLNGIGSWNDSLVAFDWSGAANDKPGYYNWDYKNFGPRIAFAWAPRMTQGLFGTLFGDGKTSVRAGFGIVYDRFGQGIADDFSDYGSFGLSTSFENPAGVETAYNAPRVLPANQVVANVDVTSIHQLPTTDLDGNILMQPAPQAIFPYTYPTDSWYIGSSLDSALKTPYAYTLDFSIARELPSGFSFEAAYVGRLAHRLLTQLDLAMPLNLKDPKNGVDYFTAVTALAKLYRTGLSTDDFNDSMVPANVAQYWTDMISPLQPGDAYSTGWCGVNPTTSPVVAAYDMFCSYSLNETSAIQQIDISGFPGESGASYFPTPGASPDNPYGGGYSFYTPQFATLYAWSSLGTSSYNAAQFDLKHKMSHGVQFDFTYTLAKSIDLASDAERVGTIGGTGAMVINSWSPYQLRGLSDFDTTHQITFNWVADLPFGRNRAIAGNADKLLDAFIGGWQLSGLGRWTSGFPFAVFNGAQWPTNYDISGDGVQIAPVKTGVFQDSNNFLAVNAFSNLADAASSFREPFPGEAGQRNNLRGPGFFSVDMGMAKRWTMPWSERHSMQLRWGVFNVTNSHRFDPQSINSSLDASGIAFGDYGRLSTKPRVMEFALRYEF